MFRTFKRTARDDPENIIVYAGDAHAEIYRSFMEFIGVDPIIEKKRAPVRADTKYYVSFTRDDKNKSFLFNQ